MRGAALLVVALLLAGCEHMYGGMDQGRLISTAVRYAGAHGHTINDRFEASVADGGSTWDVNLDPPCETCVGGPTIVSISKATRRATGLLVIQ